MATYDLSQSTTLGTLKKGDIINCPYTGEKKEITLPKGKYKLEVWGAQGGRCYNNQLSSGGFGGYSSGNLSLSVDTVLFLYSGGEGAYAQASRLR